MKFVEPECTQLQLAEPVSLARRNPLRIELTDERGKSITLRRCGVVIHAGDKVSVKVVVPQGVDVKLRPDSTLMELQCQPPIHVGANISYEYLFRACLSSHLPETLQRRLPWFPSKGELFIGCTDQAPAPIRMSIPIFVVPNKIITVITIIIGIVFIYWKPLLENELKRSLNPFDAAYSLMTSFDFIANSLLLFFGLMSLCWLAFLVYLARE